MEHYEQGRKYLKWISWVAVLGLLDSAWLFLVHLKHGSLSSVCEISSAINCGILQMHSYSEWFDVPVALFAILFYVLVLTIALHSKRQSKEQLDRSAIYLWFLSWGAVGSALYMATISFFVLKTLCPFCAILYGIAIVYFVLARRTVAFVAKPWFHLVQYDIARAHQSKWSWACLASVVLALGLGKTVFRDHGKLATEIQPIQLETKLTLGESLAPITLVSFSDFQCPHCKIAGELFHELEKQNRGKLKIVYKFFPLDATCNPLGGQHGLSCEAAYSAYCAGLQDRFWPYHDLIYTKQATLQETDFLSFAKFLNLDLGKYDECLHSESTRQNVSQIIDEGIKLGVQGTPAIFINGRRYMGPLTVESLSEALVQ